MKTALIAAALLAATLPAHAISRYESRSLTCGEAQAVIASEGAAILRYQSERNPGLTLYDRYVRNRAFCQPLEVTRYDWIPTADTRSCPVLTCEQRQFEKRHDWRFN